MSVYKKNSKMSGNENYAEKLYQLLTTDRYKSRPYETNNWG